MLLSVFFFLFFFLPLILLFSLFFLNSPPHIVFFIMFSAFSLVSSFSPFVLIYLFCVSAENMLFDLAWKHHYNPQQRGGLPMRWSEYLGRRSNSACKCACLCLCVYTCITNTVSLESFNLVCKNIHVLFAWTDKMRYCACVWTVRTDDPSLTDRPLFANVPQMCPVWHESRHIFCIIQNVKSEFKLFVTSAKVGWCSASSVR